jgi:hypothetical protein
MTQRINYMQQSAPLFKKFLEFSNVLPEHGVSDKIYDRVRSQFSEKELSDRTFDIMTINGWNRVNVAFRPVPGSADKAWGLDKANLA